MRYVDRYAILALVALFSGALGQASPAAAQNQEFLNKTYNLAYRINNANINFRIYISKTGKVYFYDNNEGNCSNTGASTVLNKTKKSSYRCNGTKFNKTLSASVNGSTVRLSETTNYGYGPSSSTFVFSSTGTSCKAISYTYKEKSSVKQFRPLGCKVKSGR